MRVKKTILAVFVMIFIGIGNVNAASFSGSCGDTATYTLVDNVLTISGTGEVNDDEGWTDYYNVVDTLIISEGIEELDARLFDGFEILSRVSLPSSLTTVGARTFRRCISLESIVIPDSVEFIGANAFYGCDNLVICCSSGSYAEEYAKSNSIAYKTIADITVSFDANGGEGSPASIMGSMTEDFVIPSQKPIKEDYIFVGWAESEDAAEAKYQIGETASFTQDTTLYAVWLQCYFEDSSTEEIIVINSTAASPALDLYVAAYDDENKMLDVIMKQVNLNPGENRIETGADWSDLERENVKAFLWDKNLTPYTECKNVLLIRNNEVIFEDWDGTILNTQSVVTGNDAALPDTPAREGYEFCGWSGNYTNITKNSRIVAQYIDSSKDNVFKVFSAKASKGDTVKITVYLGGKVETCGFNMKLVYDKDALEFIGMDAVLDLDAIANHNDTEGFIKFNYSSIKNRTKSARILEAEFKIKEAAENATTVYLTPVEIIKHDETQDEILVDADFNTEDGIITIY